MPGSDIAPAKADRLNESAFVTGRSVACTPDVQSNAWWPSASYGRMRTSKVRWVTVRPPQMPRAPHRRRASVA